MQNRIILLIFFAHVWILALAQTNGNSPYSRFGIGVPVDDNFMHLRLMGGIGSGYVDAYHVNIVNPASYANLQATAFDLGMSATRSNLSTESGNDTRQWSGNLDYMALAFPLGNPLNEILDQEKKPYKMGMAFALKPHSLVGYNISSRDSLDGLGLFDRNYLGTGGTYKFQWGTALKYKEFSFGVNLGYLFGKIEYERNVDFLEWPFPYQDRFSSSYNVTGFLFNTGLMYTKIINKKQLESKQDRVAKIFNVGLRFTPPTGFNTNLTKSQIAVQTITSRQEFRDTLSVENDIPGNGRLPMEVGIGASYFNGEKYMIGFDISLVNWSNYENDADENTPQGGLNDTYSVSLGGFYRPDYKSYKNYFKRVYYRYGVFYRKDPRVVEGEQLNHYGLTFGLGLPFIYQRKISHANIGVEFGRRGSNAPIQESYFKLSFGFTFNDDEWFLKRKYN